MKLLPLCGYFEKDFESLHLDQSNSTYDSKTGTAPEQGTESVPDFQPQIQGSYGSV